MSKTNSLTKKTLTAYIEVACGLPADKAKEVIDEMLRLMDKTLKKGDRVILTGIGSLQGKRVAPRIIKSFGKTHKVGERVKVIFRPSKRVKVKLAKAEKTVTSKSLFRTVRESLRED